jgi:hypothetical protein
MTYRAYLSITAGALIAFAGPATAQSQGAASNSFETNSANQAGEVANGSQRICVRQETTGSRLRTRVCRTRDQWVREGGVPTEESR